MNHTDLDISLKDADHRLGRLKSSVRSLLESCVGLCESEASRAATLGDVAESSRYCRRRDELREILREHY